MDQRTCGATAPPTWMCRSTSSRAMDGRALRGLRLVGGGVRGRAEAEAALRALRGARREREAVPAGGAVHLPARVDVDPLQPARRGGGRAGIIEQLGPVLAEEREGP